MIYSMEFPNLFSHSSTDSSSILLLQTMMKLTFLYLYSYFSKCYSNDAFTSVGQILTEKMGLLA